MEQDLEVREPAPEFNLPAAGSARRISMKEVSGRSLGLIFHFQGTAPTARLISRSVRARYPSTDNVLIASVTELCIVPSVDSNRAGAYHGERPIEAVLEMLETA